MTQPLESRRYSRRQLLHRFVLFGGAVAGVEAVLGARLFDLQVARGGYYTDLAVSQQTAVEPIVTKRGLIYDRKGRLLADNVPTFAVKIRPADLPFDQRDDVVGRLGDLLGMPPSDILQDLDRNAGSLFDLVRIASDIPTDTARVLAEEHIQLPGVYVDVEARREYLYGPLRGTFSVSPARSPAMSTRGSSRRATSTTITWASRAWSRRSRPCSVDSTVPSSWSGTHRVERSGRSKPSRSRSRADRSS